MKAESQKQRIERLLNGMLATPKGVYWALSCGQLRLEERPEFERAMATDGKRLVFCGDKCSTFTDAEMQFMLVHEFSHNQLRHSQRTKAMLLKYGQDATTKAMECEANCLALSSQIGTMPLGLVVPERLGLPPDMNCSWYAERLQQQEQQQKQKQQNDKEGGKDDETGTSMDSESEGQDAANDDGDGGNKSTDNDSDGQPGDDSAEAEPGDDADSDSDLPGQSPQPDGGDEGNSGDGEFGDGEPANCGDVMPADDTEQQGEAEADAAAAGNVMQSTMLAESMGAGAPSYAKRFCEQVVAMARNDWRGKLRQMLQCGGGTYTWHKLDRKYLASGQKMPGKRRATDLRRIAIMEDQSGSTLDVRGKFWKEVASLAKTFDRVELVIVPWSTRIHTAQIEYVRGRDVAHHKHDAGGSGGTEADCAMQWLAENTSKLRLKGAVVLTDGQFMEPKVDPKCRLLWVLSQAPYCRLPHGTQSFIAG